MVHIVSHGVIHGIDGSQNVSLLGRVYLHRKIAGFPILFVRLALKCGRSFAVAAIKPQTVVDVFGVIGSSAHFNYLLS